MSGMSVRPRVHRHCSVDAVRIEHIVHLDASLCDNIFFGPLPDLLAPDFREVRAAVCEGGLRLKRIEHAASFDEFEHGLARLAWRLELGFPVQAQQPYFIVDSEGCFGYSWELARTRWFFARDYGATLRNTHDGLHAITSKRRRGSSVRCASYPVDVGTRIVQICSHTSRSSIRWRYHPTHDA